MWFDVLLPSAGTYVFDDIQVYNSVGMDLHERFELPVGQAVTNPQCVISNVDCTANVNNRCIIKTSNKSIKQMNLRITIDSGAWVSFHTQIDRFNVTGVDGGSKLPDPTGRFTKYIIIIP